MGGKSKIAKYITEEILTRTTHRTHYYEPFIGGGGMAAKIGSHFDYAHYSDIHPDLMMMYKALSNGWEPPHAISEEGYNSLRNQNSPSALRGFVGFGGSFGGKFFGGLARGGTSSGAPRNHVDESARKLNKEFESMQPKIKADFSCVSVFDIDPIPGSVIYCDPPYQGTTKYSKTDTFDHGSFWSLMNQWVDKGCSVFVSEYSAPSGWSEIWTKPHRVSVRGGAQPRELAQERLFTRLS